MCWSLSDDKNPLGRYDFQLSQAVTASLPQFVLQFSAYMLTLYLLEELKVKRKASINANKMPVLQVSIFNTLTFNEFVYCRALQWIRTQ